LFFCICRPTPLPALRGLAGGVRAGGVMGGAEKQKNVEIPKIKERKNTENNRVKKYRK
jgi:hypothetical protein